MIQISDLTFSYASGDFQFNLPTLSIEKKEKTAIIGPSGSGKTTLLNLISGISVPNEGSIVINEQKISSLSDARRREFRISRMGFVFQDFALLDYLNIMDNILHPYRVTNALILNGSVRERARKLASEMGISDKLKRYPEKLSHGQKQRAAICRALITSPKLILADEATGNLDPENKTKILDLLFRQVEEKQATLVAVTHDHDLLDRFDRVIDFRDFMSGE
ncbi:MAG: ABC transporter ATP-binding protein [Desulfobacterales bacterium]|nr:ABC transporter ATP-binding protein [Desulfobacterales bacterium]